MKENKTMTPKKTNLKPKTAWSFKDAVKVFVGFISINLLLFLLGSVHAEYDTFHFLVSNNQTLNSINLYILTIATFLAPMWFFLIRNKEITPKKFGLKKLSVGKVIKMILLAYGLLLLSSIILLFIATYITPDIPGLSLQEDVLPLFGEGKLAMTVAGIIAIGIAPIIEEIFFRGYLLQSLMTKLSFLTASTITAAIFAFIHFQFESILGIFILSLIINYIYKKSGNTITATIAFHMVNNAVAMTVLLNLDKIEKLLPPQ